MPCTGYRIRCDVRQVGKGTVFRPDPPGHVAADGAVVLGLEALISYTQSSLEKKLYIL